MNIYIIIYQAVKNIGGKKLGWTWQITAIHQVFANFHYFHNIPYANGLQFDEVFFH